MHEFDNNGRFNSCRACAKSYSPRISGSRPVKSERLGRADISDACEQPDDTKPETRYDIDESQLDVHVLRHEHALAGLFVLSNTHPLAHVSSPGHEFAFSASSNPCVPPVPGYDISGISGSSVHPDCTNLPTDVATF